MYNWKLPYVSSPPNLWRMELWQHKNFTEAEDRSLWTFKTSKSPAFPEKTFVNTNENAIQKESFRFSPMLLFEQEREQKRCKKTDT